MLNLAIIAGGDSGEASVSLRSADFVLSQIDRQLFNPYIVRIINSKWDVLVNDKVIVLNKDDFSFENDGQTIKFDLAYIIIHGTPGEDGKLQGWLDMMKIPYPNCGVLCSALTFNKDACKNYLSQYGIKTAKGVMLHSGDKYDVLDIANMVGVPCFVKPNNGGSSFGASKVDSINDLNQAIEKAFSVDNEIIIEQYIKGTEITCGLYKINNEMVVLPITEVVSYNDFFDFEAKYENKSQEITPARIPSNIWKECEQTSVKIYNALNCRGIVRIDYIIMDNQLYFLEVNTIPGMTAQSFIPQQFSAKNIVASDVLSSLLNTCK